LVKHPRTLSILLLIWQHARHVAVVRRQRRSPLRENMLVRIWDEYCQTCTHIELSGRLHTPEPCPVFFCYCSKRNMLLQIDVSVDHRCGKTCVLVRIWDEYCQTCRHIELSGRLNNPEPCPIFFCYGSMRGMLLRFAVSVNHRCGRTCWSGSGTTASRHADTLSFLVG
jgi:hypothetical protein